MGGTAQVPPWGPFHILFLTAAPRGALLGLHPLIFPSWGTQASLRGFYSQPDLSLPTTKCLDPEKARILHLGVDFSMKPFLATYKRGVAYKAGDKGLLCSEQHAGSAGALLDFGQPPRAQDQQPEAEGAAREELEEEEEIVEEEEQQQQTFPVSLEDLAGHGGSEKLPGPELPGSEEEEEEEESLAVAEQVADFASSLLAALHCWHYRANALLFSRGAMVRCLFDLPSSLHVVWHVHVLPVSFPLSPTLSPPSCCQYLTHCHTLVSPWHALF